jgi:hypothetical protein
MRRENWQRIDEVRGYASREWFALEAEPRNLSSDRLCRWVITVKIAITNRRFEHMEEKKARGNTWGFEHLRNSLKG